MKDASYYIAIYDQAYARDTIVSVSIPREHWLTISAGIDRLRAGLLGHACYCGSSDPDHSVHREDCPYRKWASPEPQTDRT